MVSEDVYTYNHTVIHMLVYVYKYNFSVPFFCSFYTFSDSELKLNLSHDMYFFLPDSFDHIYA